MQCKVAKVALLVPQHDKEVKGIFLNTKSLIIIFSESKFVCYVFCVRKNNSDKSFNYWENNDTYCCSLRDLIFQFQKQAHDSSSETSFLKVAIKTVAMQNCLLHTTINVFGAKVLKLFLWFCIFHCAPFFWQLVLYISFWSKTEVPLCAQLPISGRYSPF